MEYIQYIKSIPSDEGKAAEMTLFRNQPNDAEKILLQANPPMIYRAIKMNIGLYRWSRALEIALKFKSHVNIVLSYRYLYLQEIQQKENLLKFQSYMNSNEYPLLSYIELKQKDDDEMFEEKSRYGSSISNRK